MDQDEELGIVKFNENSGLTYSQQEQQAFASLIERSVTLQTKRKHFKS